MWEREKKVRTPRGLLKGLKVAEILAGVGVEQILQEYFAQGDGPGEAAVRRSPDHPPGQKTGPTNVNPGRKTLLAPNACQPFGRIEDCLGLETGGSTSPFS